MGHAAALAVVRLTLLAAALLAAPTLRAESEGLECAGGHFLFAAPDSSEYLKYAPSREVDVLHVAIDVTPDFKARTIAGKTTVRFKPVAKPLAELKLNAVDLRVSAVVSSEKLLAWQATEEHVILSFEPGIPVDRETTVTITYTAEPRQGLYFRTPEMGYRPEDTHLWTQGEPLEARHWFPSFDAPNEKFTSEVTCRVPDDMTVVSNGRLKSEEKDSSTGLKVVQWLQDKPHANYLIALVAGYVKKVEDKYRDIPLAFYTPASQIEYARNSFKETKEIMAFFEEEIGVPYPWAKYDQVCVNDFTAGGMENTSLTILSDRTLHTPASEELRESRGLVAHELAHQWFGDLVTCKDWSHLWLNEGFATYYTHLFEGHKDGRDEMLYGLYQSAKGIVGQPNDTNAIVRRDFNSPDEQFGFHAYPKGSWILHMLRSQLGDELYRRCVKTYLERHQYSSVVTEDLNRVLEELSGRSFDQFFNQYVYHAHHPELGVTYSWDDRAKLAKVSVSQNQRLSEDVLLFSVPLTVRFKGKFGTIDRQLKIQQKAEDFYLPLPGPPEIVRIDPDVALLAKIGFTPSTPMLFAQLADKSDAIGRLIAAEQLNGKREALSRLKDALNEDSFYPVRLAASASLRSIQSESALRALLDSTKQKDARVRRQVGNDIAGYYRDEAFTNALRVLNDEKNPEIRAASLSRLAGWSRPEVREQILAALKAETFHNVLEDAAVTAARGQDDPAYIPPILEMLKAREGDATTALTTRSLDAVAWLSRNEENKDVAREVLLARVNSPKQRVRVASLNGLGTLRDQRAAPVLEKFASGSKTSPERSAAERSLAALRETAKPSVELGNLRGEVLTLQRENRELRKEMDDLKKKLDALSPSAKASSDSKESKDSGDPKPTKASSRPSKR